MKRRALMVAVACLVAMLASHAYSLGSADRANADWNTVRSGERVTVTGHVRLVGSEPFTEYVITDAAGRDWYVGKAERAKVKAYEQRPITVEAVATRDSMTLADGTKLEDRRVLEKIKIIK